MEFDFDFILGLSVFTVLMYVVAAIVVDTVFGVAVALRKGEFEWQELPRFLGSNVVPFVFGLLALAVVAEYAGEVFEYIFYASSVAVFARYVAKLVEKAKQLFGIELGA